MFFTLSTSLAALPESETVSFSQATTVFDWTPLGCFIGSRISEYAQVSLPKGQAFAIIPSIPESTGWDGFPIAFIATDFAFFLTPTGGLSIMILSPLLWLIVVSRKFILFSVSTRALPTLLSPNSA
jgi:hypothetical protein